LVDEGDDAVSGGHQLATGIEMPIGKYAQIYKFRGGKVVHWKLYMSQAEALEAAGLSPR